MSQSCWQRGFRALLLVLYGAGLRRAEALSLTLADIDLPAAVLTVRETKFDKNVDRIVMLNRAHMSL